VNEEPTRRSFRIGASQQVRPSDPESLFRDLKIRRSDIKHLWSHQADILRTYEHSFIDTGDVALELPTGTGKTLIGLLIAEYRRRKLDQRAVYLCPTKLLARQVASQAYDYGIAASTVVAPQYVDLNRYRMGELIAVTTYSALFNSAPRFNDAQTIVLDDAHAGESFIASMWRVTIDRNSHAALYERIVRQIADDLEPGAADALLDASGQLSASVGVELVPWPRLQRHVSALRDLLDAALEYQSNAWYGWQAIRGHVEACNFFLSWRELELRPLIPPTHTHAPFADAKQRLFMSATLGNSGELERLSGVRHITRLPLPEGWERQGSGRRLFLFPNFSMKSKDADLVSILGITTFDRGLVLTPSNATAEAVASTLSRAGVDVLRALDVEESLEPFTASSNVALVLANRYDGMDLPDEACRFLVLSGLPMGTTLQERFLLTRLGATALFRDRARTRFTQGIGRCTRNPTDYSAVVVLGQDLFDFCARHENVAGMHPELQAEIDFGLRNSDGTDLNGFTDLLQLFREQGEDWRQALDEIIRLREAKVRHPDPLAQTLARLAPLEVDYVAALWQRDFGRAIEMAVAISDQLGGADTTEYRAWWYYLGAHASLLAVDAGIGSVTTQRVDELLRAAATASKTISWLMSLAGASTGLAAGEFLERDSINAHACERVFAQLADAGFSGRGFERDVDEIQEQLGGTDSTAYELGLKALGRWLGFDSERPPGSGTPDGVWLLTPEQGICFEAKSSETPNDPISLDTVRQAATHVAWVKQNRTVSANVDLATVIVSPRTSLSSDAVHAASYLYYAHVSAIAEIAAELFAVLRKVRAESGGADQARTTETISGALNQASLLPGAVLNRLKSHPLISLPAR
jgi:hypothetical protein